MGVVFFARIQRIQVLGKYPLHLKLQLDTLMPFARLKDICSLGLRCLKQLMGGEMYATFRIAPNS